MPPRLAAGSARDPVVIQSRQPKMRLEQRNRMSRLELVVRVPAFQSLKWFR
jgi:hypothetical protein